MSDLDAFHGGRQVLHGVSLQLQERECLALVGESGSGKTTLARAIIGLHTPRSGDIRLNGAVLPVTARARSKEVCRVIQYVFQSPTSSLNPRRTIGEILGTPVDHFFGLRGRDADARVAELLERVALPSSAASRYAGELSGGERQRVSIARALAANPDILICDEITSALDTSVQAAIVRLLEDLQEAGEPGDPLRDSQSRPRPHNRLIESRSCTSGESSSTAVPTPCLDDPSARYTSETHRGHPVAARRSLARRGAERHPGGLADSARSPLTDSNR